MFHTTQLLLDQAASFQQAGKWQAAVHLCESIFESGWRRGEIEDVIEVLLRLGFLYNSTNDRELAEDYFSVAAVIAELQTDNARAARAYNGLGIVNQNNGRITAAEELYLRAQQRSNRCKDEKTSGDAHMNLGVLASIRGELKTALKYYKRALNNFEAAGNQQSLARVLNNLGMLYVQLQQFEVAEASLDRALHIGRLLGNAPLEGIVLANKAELQIASGNVEAARQACDEAFEFSARLGNQQLKAEILKSYGVIFREIDKPYLAESHLRQAIEISAEHGSLLTEADAQRELALLLRGEGRNREALDALNSAHFIFTNLQAKHHQAELDDRLRQLEADFLQLVEMWGESIEAKDLYTKGHCQRVAEYGYELAVHAGIPAKDLVWFRMGAFLHDVGKTEIPAEILNKPGRLTDEERLIIEGHTTAGDQLLSDTEFPYDIRPMVRSHHERWDGRGYPDGLSGEDIPLTARILHVVDVYDALTTARSYRAPLTREEALQIMTTDEGSFDPILLELFCSLLQTVDFRFQQPQAAAS